MKMYVLIALTLASLHITDINAQLTGAQLQNISEVLQPVADPTKPGVSAAVIVDGKVAHIEANGLANLATGAKSNENTLYQVDALAKQFTTLAFLHLINSGEVSKTDNIRQYLPELPEYNYPITIDHILNHTTGLNNYYVVNQLQGMHGSLAINNADAIQIIATQDKLTHEPGADFSMFDSRTESLLMAEIISKVSKVSFAEYVEKHVFEPLQLHDAVFVDNHEMMPPNVALPYFNQGDQLGIISDANNIVGPTNLYISISDLAKYYTLFSPKATAPGHDLVKQLDIPVRNNKGETYVDGWGEMSTGRSFLHPERGVPMYWQFGIVSAYGANVFRHPDQDIIAIAIGNNNSYNGMYAMPLIAPIMEDHYKTPASIGPSFIKSINLPTSQINKWAGDYFNPIDGQVRQFEVRQDTLRYVRGQNATTLLPIGDGSFQAVMQSDDILKFHFNEDANNKYYDVVTFEGSKTRYEAISPDYNPLVKELSDYTGTYINEGIGQILKFNLVDDQLVATHYQNAATTFRPIKEDVFASYTYALSTLTFERVNGSISGFITKAGGISHLRFTKVAPTSTSNL